MVKFFKDGYVIEVRGEEIENEKVTIISIPLECVETHELLKNYKESDELFHVVMTEDHVLIHAREEFELDVVDSNPIVRFFADQCMWEFDIEQMTLVEVELYQYRFADETQSGKCEVINRRTKKVVRLRDEDVKVVGVIDLVDREVLRQALLPKSLRKLK